MMKPAPVRRAKCWMAGQEHQMPRSLGELPSPEALLGCQPFTAGTYPRRDSRGTGKSLGRMAGLRPGRLVKKRVALSMLHGRIPEREGRIDKTALGAGIPVYRPSVRQSSKICTQYCV